jgi:DNA-binding transcriptional regulator YiaG
MPATRSEKLREPLQAQAVTAPAEKSTGPKLKIKHAPVAEVPQPESGKQRSPSAQLVVDVRTGLGVTRACFARMTGFSVSAISGWETGRPLSEGARQRVMELKRLRDALADRIQGRYIAAWLENPCEGLGGARPVEILERGESDRLWRTVHLIGSGMPT